MERTNNRNTVFQVAGQIVSELNHTLDTSSHRATMAKLRNSIGKPLSETIEIWPLIFEKFPEDFLSASGIATDQEKAILTALQFYALHQQGNRASVSLNEATDKWENIGNSLRYLRDKDSLAIDRRFNTMITSTDFDELTYHLRQLIMLMKTKENIKVNYAKLAEDLYCYLRGNQERVRIRWAQSYYKMKLTEEKGETQNVD